MYKLRKNTFKYPKNKAKDLYVTRRFRKHLKMAEGSNDFNTSSQCNLRNFHFSSKYYFKQKLLL